MCNNNLNSLLIVNDIAGYGKVSTLAMIPILSHYGIHTYSLPTAIVSNTLDYGKFEILDTTEFMKNAVQKWHELGFRFPYIATGLINSDEQIDIILDLINTQDSAAIFVDPIMGDSGSLYDGMYPGVIECNRRMAAKADILIPNFTEATMLAGMFEGRNELSKSEYTTLTEALLNLGAKNIVISSCRLKDPHSTVNITPDSESCFNVIFDAGAGSLDFIPYENISAQFIGTGDMFSAVIIAETIKGKSLYSSVQSAAEFVGGVISQNRDIKDRYDIPLENSLSLISK